MKLKILKIITLFAATAMLVFAPVVSMAGSRDFEEDVLLLAQEDGDDLDELDEMDDAEEESGLDDVELGSEELPAEPTPATPDGGDAPLSGDELEVEEEGDGAGADESDVLPPPEVDKSRVPQVYVVQPGDNLWDIANRYFLNPYQWNYIYGLNKFIEDADLIFPGEPITMYPKVEVETPIVEVGPGGEEDIEGAEPDEIVEDLPVDTPPEQVLEGRDGFLENIGIELPAEIMAPSDMERLRNKWPPMSPNKLFFGQRGSEGYIAFLENSELEKAGYVVGQPDAESRVEIAEGDKVYINRGRIHGVAEKDRFYIFRVTEEVDHPGNGELMGNLIKYTGVLEVKDVRESVSTCKVTKSFMEIDPLRTQYGGVVSGDRITPFEKASTVVRTKMTSDDIEGYIVATRNDRISLSNADIVYIDKGEKDGVKVGFIFHVFKRGKELENPDDDQEMRLPAGAMGELVILSTRPHSSTAIVTVTLREFKIGDKVTTTVLKDDR